MAVVRGKDLLNRKVALIEILVVLMVVMEDEEEQEITKGKQVQGKLLAL